MATVKTEASNISNDMRELYESFKSGVTGRDAADTLANIAGKNLKALSLLHADSLREDALIKAARNAGTANEA